MSIQAKMAARETPAGRRHEATCIFNDCMILIVGCLAVALWIPPIIYAAAAGHLLMVVFLSPVPWLGALMELPALAVKCALYLAGVYAAQVFYGGVASDTVVTAIKDTWLLQCAVGVVVFGIIGSLMTYPGTVENLCVFLNREDAARKLEEAG